MSTATKRAHTILSGRLEPIGQQSGKPYHIVYIYTSDSEERRKEAYLESKNDPDHYGGTFYGENIAFLYIEGYATKSKTVL